MKEFLKTVVDHYLPAIKTPDGRIDSLGLTDYLFVFPNRRSGLFFNKYLYERVGAPVFAPDMTTISDLFPRLNDGRQLRVLDRIELLIYLYNIYIEVSGSSESFDSFLFWGEMLLGDFNDADKYLVDAKMLFENVKDLKEIDEKFFSLEPEQIKIIRTFWTNFNPTSQGESKELFRQTWKILYDLYSRLRSRLLAEGLAYDGMLQRMIVEDLRRKEAELTFDAEKARLQRLLGKKVVFVGLTALSKTDTELMRHLSKYEVADFCWDYADPRLNDKNSHASYFRSSTIGVFPNVLDEAELKNGLVADSEKHFEVIEVPSGVGQTVQAAAILRQLAKQENFNAFRTAVVLPDEKMLLPMLYAIPKDYEPFNVTMGYSLRTTNVATFIDNLAQLQANVQKNREGAWTFYYKNVQPLLGTNYLLKMSDGTAATISQDIVKNNRYRVTQETFRGNRLFEKVFRPCRDGRDCMKYLSDILEIFARQAEAELAEKETLEEQDMEDIFGEMNAAERPQGIFSEVEREFLFSYISLVKRLEEKLGRSDIEINPATFFSLLHKLAQSETVAFSGEPLSGLQVMGVLETRGVDFDNLIILSMNEGVFPAKPVTNTFVPMNLRFAFGMPTQAHRDAVYAYHFYRLISRAKNIVMIYDSRSEGLQGGEPSRYIKQLTYLYGIKPEMKSVQYNIGVEESSPITVTKDERIMARLSQCIYGEGERNLSASALKHYISCPLQFYFEFIEGLREEDEIEENIDDKAFGSILHETMEEIYNSVKGRMVTADDIGHVIKEKDAIRRMIEKHFAHVMKINEITGYLALVEEIILTYVIDILEHDRLLAPFEYISSEESQVFPYIVSDEQGREQMTVRIRAIFDRLDRVFAASPDVSTLRIVDYKTGKTKIGDRSKLLVPEISTVFNADSNCSEEAFQVMLYSLLIRDFKEDSESLANFKKLIGSTSQVSPNLYFVRDFHQNPELKTELQYDPDKKARIGNFNVHKEDFRRAFDGLLRDIFDPEKPFTQTENKKNCRYCPFKDICKKE